MKGLLTCVLPEDDGPTSSVNCPTRNPPLSKKSILSHATRNILLGILIES
jgi:hypothetical protein